MGFPAGARTDEPSRRAARLKARAKPRTHGNALTRIIAAVDRYQQHHPWLAFPVAVFKRFGDDEAGNLAALIAYYGFFSLFPLLLVLVTALGFVLSGHPGLQDRILHSTLAQFPVIGDQIQTHRLQANGIGLIIGLAGLIWGGLGAMQAAENAMNDVWHVPKDERPNFIYSRVRAVLMLAVIGAGIISTTVLAGLGISNLTLFLRIPGLAVTAAVDFGLFLLTFKVLTDADVGWRDFVPGAVFAAVAWTVLQAVGGYYVSHQLKGASQTYGVFAVVIGLLSWLYLQAQITLLAAEINVVKKCRLWPRKLQGEEDDQPAVDAVEPGQPSGGTTMVRTGGTQPSPSV